MNILYEDNQNKITPKVVDFYHIRHDYLEFLQTMDTNKNTPEIQPDTLYLGVMFFKDSAYDERLNFFIPCRIPNENDFIYDIDIHENMSEEDKIAHRIGTNSQQDTLLLFSDNWGEEQDFKVVFTLDFTGLIPVPPYMVELYDETLNPEMHNRILASRSGALNGVFKVNVINKACIDFYADKIMFESGKYNPDDFLTPEDAKKEKEILSAGFNGIQSEVSCICYSSDEYIKMKQALEEQNPITANLYEKKFSLMFNKAKREVQSLVVYDQEKPKSKKKVPYFSIG